MGERKTWQRACVDCGKAFVARNFNAVRCPDCQKERNKVRKHAFKERNRKNLEGGAACCAYCGGGVPEGQKYCRRCVEEGLSNLHSEFGMTNGWDKKRSVRDKPPALAGWRGRPMCGGPVTRDPFSRHSGLYWQ